MRKYRLVAKKGEGTFSEVLKAQNVKDGRYHAIKCMKSTFDNIEQVNNLREIQALRRLSPHEHVITLEEVLYDQPTGRLALVFELMDANLYELIRGRKQFLNPMLIKSYMWQLMKSLDHMHKKGIFHRDIKPENILIESGSDMGRGLKLADFGSCRGIFSKQPYTEYISTRWYRAPECLLTDGYYGPEMDLWGAGCVMFEITSLYPLFPGTNEIDQATKIHKVLGTPSREMLQKFKSKAKLNSLISFEFPYQKGVGIPGLIPHASSECIDLIIKLLKYEAADRITAKEAMRHPYFRDIREFEKKTVHAVSNVTVVKEITKNPDLPDSKYNENDPTLKSQGQNNRITPDQMSSSQPKVLPNILDKGTGVMTGRVGVKHTTQHQNQQEKNNNVTYGKSYGGTAVAVSSLPPIALGASNSANNTINNKQVKPTWPPRRRKSKTGIIPIANAISSSSNSASMGAESFYTNHQIGSNTSSIKSSNTGGAGSGLTQQQAILKSQLTRAYGVNPPPRTVTGVGVGIGALKLGVKIEGNSPTGPLKDLLLNSKKIAV